MTDHKSPLQRALDVFVYAPVGLALTAAEELPGLVKKGRERINQVNMARVVGQFVADKGAQEAGKAVKQATEALAGLGVGAGARPPVRPAGQANGGGASSASPSPTSAPPSVNGSTDGHRVAAPPSDDLAIPGYDALSASQVVQRLGGLAPAELEAVREYETATRGRRTILSKIAQLQTEQS
jgi:hypothetical protein